MYDLSNSLKKCSLFKNKSIDEIQYLLSNIIYSIKSFSKNEIILSSNQIANTMGIILSGFADVQKFFPSGKVVIIARKEKNDLIAEPSIFSNTKYYPATISACEACRIIFIHKNELLKLFLMDEELMQNFLESVSNSMIILKNKIGILSLNSIQEKISYFLIDEYRRNNCNIVKLPFSKKVWAEYMNVSRPSLSRELRKLEMEGIISFDKNIIEIHDLERLEKILFQQHD
ncbi:MAG: Crp/Fnr family transcriptional regulator [Maledivibacter sp.]|jgi:CRP-like cAMP-binding protein|nr:Crp/Fnr family transcriptional regulator [Maledivibacter sp.]